MLAERPQLLCHPAVYYTWQPCLLIDDLDVVAPNSYLISPANSYVISPEYIYIDVVVEMLRCIDIGALHFVTEGCCEKAYQFVRLSMP